MKSTASCVAVLFITTLVLLPTRGAAQEVLPSWKDERSKQAIVDFVSRVTDPHDAQFVAESERIAVFDNDGTLWCEQPMYVQLAFALDRVRELAPQHPEWRENQPFKAVLENDLAQLAAAGERGLLELVMATHAGLTNEEFAEVVRQWIAQARHPKFGRPYTECVYQPMLELLDYLRAHQFKVYLVSGGGVEFMRVWAEQVYGIPPEQIIGSSIKLKYELRQGKPTLVRLPEIDFIDDRAGKPIGIQSRIGRRPLIAVGNSDGDYEMLDYVTFGEGPSLGLLIHHTDELREFAYDRDSDFGRLDRALTDAPGKGWIVVDVKKEWSQVFPARQ